MAAISLILLFLASVINAQDIIYAKHDDSCTLPNGESGLCKEHRLCPEAFANFPKELPVNCGFIGKRVIVCCPVKIDHVSTEPAIVDVTHDISPPVVDFRCGDSFPAFAFPIDDTPKTCEPGFSCIFHGEPAPNELVKYAALVGSRHTSGEINWFCTGVLLNHRWVLTAAHCYEANINVVRLGEFDYTDDNDGANPMDYDVLEVIPHAEYSYPQAYQDLALIKLSSRVTFGESINPICLPWGVASEKNLTDANITVTGWGITQDGGRGSSIPLVIHISLFANSVCQEVYPELRNYKGFFPRDITEELLCAGDLEEGRDSCQGDSGGPAVYLGYELQYVLAGVVAAGVGCGQTKYPGLYTNIRHPPYLAWIKKVAFS